MTKLIQSPLNHTGLLTGDVISVAKAVASNIDDSLFGGACIESLDRIPPTLTWAAKPADGDFVHGTVMLTVTATDDIDLPPAPAVKILGYTDADGDTRIIIATAAANTSSLDDG